MIETPNEPVAIEPLQVLTLGGQRRPSPDLDPYLDDLDVTLLWGLYRDMVIARRIDTEAIALQRQGELGLWPSMLGQEGAQIGAAYALRDQDVVFPTYREHGVAWCRGVDPLGMYSLFRGTTLGGWDPKASNVHLYTLVIGAQTLHAVGFAMGIVRDGDIGSVDGNRDRAVLTFLGDGALSEGETNEALVWAAAQDLPVVFFCQNNQWAISAPYSVQSRVPAAQRPRGFGIRSQRVDGNDVLACLAATRRALEAARAGRGPTFIEALTYRRNPHTTSDDDGRYRDEELTNTWAERDPIARLTTHLQTVDAEANDKFQDINLEGDALAARWRAGCISLPDPTQDTPFLTTLSSPSTHLRRQMDEHLAFVASQERVE